MKTLYVSDLDGTLITRGERIPEYSLGVLNELIRQGLSFTYATARSLASAESAVRGLRHTLPVIVYNGALIIEAASRKVLHSVTFRRETEEALVARLDGFGVSPVVHACENGEDKIFWVRGRESAGTASLSFPQGGGQTSGARLFRARALSRRRVFFCVQRRL